ncbi:unnamed protein product [Cuscuta epithymum]|uniref:Uncharacterized protein n=1 Tax=Cuscuta epithymum TaxID=186058 RepID=A0AAV0FKI6_9ASTE|nr:unnamed protein product [Cuscuta epithymum]
MRVVSLAHASFFLNFMAKFRQLPSHMMGEGCRLRTLEYVGDRWMFEGKGEGLVLGGQRGILGDGDVSFRLVLVGTFLMEEPRRAYMMKIRDKAKAGGSRLDGVEVDLTQKDNFQE